MIDLYSIVAGFCKTNEKDDKRIVFWGKVNEICGFELASSDLNAKKPPSTSKHSASDDYDFWSFKIIVGLQILFIIPKKGSDWFE